MTADVVVLYVSPLVVLVFFLFQSLLMTFFLVSWYAVYVAWMIN